MIPLAVLAFVLLLIFGLAAPGAFVDLMTALVGYAGVCCLIVVILKLLKLFGPLTLT